MKDTTERSIIHEEETRRKAFDACLEHKLFDTVDIRVARRVFDIGFRMGFRHPHGARSAFPFTEEDA